MFTSGVVEVPRFLQRSAEHHRLYFSKKASSLGVEGALFCICNCIMELNGS